jgi:hypothetical protein
MSWRETNAVRQIGCQAASSVSGVDGKCQPAGTDKTQDKQMQFQACNFHGCF